MEDMKILVMSNSWPGVWGKANTIKEALAIARKQNGGPIRQYIVLLIHKDSYVDDMGSIIYPKNFSPREIHRVGSVKKEKK